MKYRYLSMEQRLIANSVETPSGCWEWIGKRDKRSSTPYGKINMMLNGKHCTRQAHIVSYETFIGPVPEGCELDHKCYNGFCIHPNHLQAVPKAVNLARRRPRGART